MIFNNSVHIIEIMKVYNTTAIVYLCGIVAYNIFGCYSDSMDYLNRFRQNQLTEYEKKKILTEWDAVKYGANNNYLQRFYDSVMYPFNTISKTISNIIPMIVLLSNFLFQI